MESATSKLPAARLPHDERDRPVCPGLPVPELLELWREGKEGAGKRKGDRLFARNHADRVDV